MCGIYKIQNLINSKTYIGCSVNIEERWRHHKQLYNNSASFEYNKPLYCAIRKYGIENFSFEVIEECTADLLAEKEQYYIQIFDCCRLDGIEKGYNLTRGGEGYLIHDYQEIIELWKNGLNQKEIAQLIHTDEATIIRALNTSDISSLERRRRAGYNTAKKSMQPVLQYDKQYNFIKEFASMSEAARETQTDQHDIKRVCIGERRTAGGYIWKYKT